MMDHAHAVRNNHVSATCLCCLSACTLPGHHQHVVALLIRAFMCVVACAPRLLLLLLMLLPSHCYQGCYDVGLPSHKSLFQLHAERLLAVQRLAAAAAGSTAEQQPVQLPWYIMTSPFTHQDTL